MRSVSTARLTYLAGETLTESDCWLVTRKDGLQFPFTSIDVSLPIDGLTFQAATGFTPSAIAHSAGLAVDNLEVVGILSSDAITEADAIAGKWDDATITIFSLNYLDINQGRTIHGSGKIGNVDTGRLSFKAELRGKTQQLQQPVGEEVTSAGCRDPLGGPRCKVNLAPWTVMGAVTAALGDKRTFVDTGRLETWMAGGGKLTWLTSANGNAGLNMEVKTWTLGTNTFVLVLPMPYDVAVGDTYSVYRGCDHKHQIDSAGTVTGDCKNVFANVINFRGEPFLPGNMKVLGQGSTP